MKLWLDDVRPAPDGFVHAKTARDAMEIIRAGIVSEVSLDHDLGDDVEDGYVVANFIESLAYHGEVRRMRWSVHSANPVGRARMSAALARADEYWDKAEGKTDEEAHGTGAGAGAGADGMLQGEGKEGVACGGEAPGTKPDVIHILRSGRAMCGRAGAPCDWPDGETWVGIEWATLATCPGCALRAKPPVGD